MGGPSESSVRRLWELLTPTTLLYTSQGWPLTVLSTGAPNADGGPDYTDALIRLNGRLFRGDVEIHCRDRDWFLHHHQTDPHYNKVILHVVGLQSAHREDVHTAGERKIPTLVLSPECIPSTDRASAIVPLGCMAANDTLTQPCRAASVRKVLRRLGWRRIERRVTILESRLIRFSLTTNECKSEEAWDQLLYEGFVEGLGYAKNKRAFRELAQILPLSLLRRYRCEDRNTLMALFFGVSGLLPASTKLRDRESKRVVVLMRKRWKALRKTLHCTQMHEADWLFFRLRPVNFPTARIAVLVHLLPQFLQEGAARSMLACFGEPGLKPQEIRDRLRSFFAFAPGDYWRSHLHFHGSGPGPSIALGSDRIDGIIFNTLVPLALLYARLSGERTLRAQVIAFARVMPASARNSVIRKVERCAIGGTMPLNSALLQYGAIELWKIFCEEKRCERCPLGPPASRRATRVQMSDI
jgi:hypothetical protein